VSIRFTGRQLSVIKAISFQRSAFGSLPAQAAFPSALSQRRNNLGVPSQGIDRGFERFNS
jgi:hypothetical protein